MLTSVASIVTTSAMVGPAASPTRSWWLENLPDDELPPTVSKPPAAVDIAVIGAGMTGCSVAYWLSKVHGLSCTVFDARGVGGGATGRNGGHLWPNPSNAFEAEQTAELLEFITSAGVKCDLQRGSAVALERRVPESGVEYADVPHDPEDAQPEEAWDETAQWDEATCAANLGTTAFSHASVYEGAYQFWPARVAASLLRVSGATLCSPVVVDSLSDSDDGEARLLSWRVACAPEAGSTAADAAVGGVVRARRVVVCTNGWATELLPELSAHMYPTRNQV